MKRIRILAEVKVGKVVHPPGTVFDIDEKALSGLIGESLSDGAQKPKRRGYIDRMARSASTIQK